jgi:hypothetical protein
MRVIFKLHNMKRLHNFYTAMTLLMMSIYGAYGHANNGRAVVEVRQTDNILVEKEIKDGWKLLFDGKSSNGWMNAKTKQFPSNGWEIKDGFLIINPSIKGQGGGGDIVSTGKYRNFELSVDFKYSPGANSGIKYFIDAEKDNGEYSSIGCEYQILDDNLHPDAKEGITGNRTLAGLYDLIAPKPKKDNGPDKWNTATIIVKGNHVQHWLNGSITVEYDRGNQAWRDLVATSKFKKIPGFGENPEGRILLQDHGNVVAFKNIKIKELK